LANFLRCSHPLFFDVLAVAAEPPGKCKPIVASTAPGDAHRAMIAAIVKILFDVESGSRLDCAAAKFT
jgi:hypothetical protein